MGPYTHEQLDVALSTAENNRNKDKEKTHFEKEKVSLTTPALEDLKWK